MKIMLFGATGMVGQGVLRECLRRRRCDAGAQRRPQAERRRRIRSCSDLIVPDLTDYSAVEDQLAGFDACFFCLGVSSVGMSEEDYRRITYDLTLAAAQTLARLNPQMTFVYVSGAGTDSTERGPSMWARVKGATENALMRLPFKAAYMFRPGFIQPMHGVRSKTALYQAAYVIARPVFGLLRRWAPNRVTTSVQVGRAMLVGCQARRAACRWSKCRDINALR